MPLRVGNSLMLAAAALCCTWNLSGATREALDSPNFVVLFADDFGWGDMFEYGHPTQEHGPLDVLAEEGLRFTQWYSAEAFCTPSRAGMMTGRLPIRSGMVPQGTQGGRVLSPSSTGGLPADEVSLAELVKPMGYTTGFTGKWHLGINNETSTDGSHLPSHHGFDDVGLILPFSNHWACDESKRHEPKPSPDVCFVYKNDTIIQQPIDHSNLTANFVQDSLDFMRKNADKPFLLYHAFAHMHVSMFTSPAFSESSVNGIWGDNQREMAWAVGQLKDEIINLGLGNNTIIFFTSDHGPHIELCLEGGTTSLLRGGKGYSSWEGGVRVPGIVWWPGTVQPGVTDALASTMDIFATIADFSHAPLPDKTVDGKSLRPVMMGESQVGHDCLFHYCADRLMAVHCGNYKARFFHQQLPFDNYSTVHCTSGSPHGEFFQTSNCYGEGIFYHDPPQLFDISSDAGELYPLNTAEHTPTLEYIMKAVAAHNETVIHVPSQMIDKQGACQPCCGGAAKGCNCNYPNPNPGLLT